ERPGRIVFVSRQGFKEACQDLLSNVLRVSRLQPTPNAPAQESLFVALLEPLPGGGTLPRVLQRVPHRQARRGNDASSCAARAARGLLSPSGPATLTVAWGSPRSDGPRAAVRGPHLCWQELPRKTADGLREGQRGPAPASTPSGQLFQQGRRLSQVGRVK